MSNILFFSIPAHGHTNPTLQVTEELVRRGHAVRYYSFEAMREKITATGAQFVSCDPYLPPVNTSQMQRLKQVSSTEMTLTAIQTTLLIDSALEQDIRKFRPDCIVSDSVCFWGKLAAKKHGIPLVCSTTTFAFNRESSQYIANSPRELLDLILGLPRISRALKKLRPLGYHVKNALELVQNDESIPTIVYTSRHFQPHGDTFSHNFAFIGPSVRDVPKAPRSERKLIYVAIGTVLSDDAFFRSCLDAARRIDADFILSTGTDTDIAALGQLPPNVQVFPRVDQMAVLSRADLFLTHCGMNSVSEALYMGVPMLLRPQTGEQKAVARRTRELGAGAELTGQSPDDIRAAIENMLSDSRFTAAAEELSRNLRSCTGAPGAADFIESVIKTAQKERSS